MRSSFYSSRSKVKQNKLTVSPIFGNNARKEHVKSSDYKFDEISMGSNYSTADYQSQQEMPLSSSVLSVNQSYNQQYPYKSFSERDQYYDNNSYPYTPNSIAECTSTESLTRKTESLIEKMERFELKLEESKKLIENLRKERQDLIIQADRIDEILTNEGSPAVKHKRLHSTTSSPGQLLNRTSNSASKDSPQSIHYSPNKLGSKKVSTFASMSQRVNVSSRKGHERTSSKIEDTNSHSHKKVSFI